jgi:hypothetical protein
MKYSAKIILLSTLVTACENAHREKRDSGWDDNNQNQPVYAPYNPMLYYLWGYGGGYNSGYYGGFGHGYGYVIYRNGVSTEYGRSYGTSRFSSVRGGFGRTGIGRSSGE